MAKIVFALSTSMLALSLGSPASAATTVYSGRAAFLGALGTQVTDAYSPAQGYAPGFSVLNDAAMSAVFGETDYEATGFGSLQPNIIIAERYCAGCNGSFRLTFTSTSVGTNAGVFGAGLDILFNFAADQGSYTALVTFGDLTQSIYALSAAPGFYGITSDLLIRSITIGPNPSTTNSGSFQIDNLTIGSVGGVVPEPASWALMTAGFGLSGAAMRRRKASVRVTYA
jgi:PEP-CTERM motif